MNMYQMIRNENFSSNYSEKAFKIFVATKLVISLLMDIQYSQPKMNLAFLLIDYQKILNATVVEVTPIFLKCPF